ncbi:hypothetical protein WBG99_14385 [Streptomyces sp. TG1A-60]
MSEGSTDDPVPFSADCALAQEPGFEERGRAAPVVHHGGLRGRL